MTSINNNNKITITNKFQQQAIGISPQINPVQIGADNCHNTTILSAVPRRQIPVKPWRSLSKEKWRGLRVGTVFIQMELLRYFAFWEFQGPSEPQIILFPASILQLYWNALELKPEHLYMGGIQKHTRK